MPFVDIANRVALVDGNYAADINALMENIRITTGKTYTLTGSEITSTMTGWSLVDNKIIVWKTRDGQTWISGNINATYTAITGGGQLKILGCNLSINYNPIIIYYSIDCVASNLGSDIKFDWSHIASYGNGYISFKFPIVSIPAWAV